MYDVILLTEEQYQDRTAAPDDWYVNNLLTEDRLVQEALEKRGLKVRKVGWSNPTFDWTQARVAVFRTTWDYFHRFEEFEAWLGRMEQLGLSFINPLGQIRWNQDKHYLKDLETQGIRITPTHIIEPGTQTTLEALHQTLGWSHTVLKPAISGAARHTYKLSPENRGEHEAPFQALVAKEAMLLQPFQNYVMETGEVSLMVIGGKYTHAVLKVAKPGDFRVQDDFGGTLHPYTPTAAEVAFAERAVAACSPTPAYARVDVIYDNEGQLAVQELEMIEPELWFRRLPEAADRLAETIFNQLQA